MLRLSNPRYPDEKVLIRLAKNDDSDAREIILNNYLGLIKNYAKKFWLPGGDINDLIQEGCLGLERAIRDFRSEKGAPFSSFARLCIERNIIVAVKTATRKKHRPLNEAVSIYRPVSFEKSELFFVDYFKSKQIDPAEILIQLEMREELKQKLTEDLSDLEASVLILYSEGKSYKEMAKELKRRLKAINNALQRAKAKAIKIYEKFNSP